MTFSGFPPDAFVFFEELAANNSKSFWETNKSRYLDGVKSPFQALSTEVESEFGPLRLFRPNRDVRFASDKSPYKTNAGALTEGEGGEIYYVHIDAEGLMAASGYYAMGTDQLARYRQAVDHAIYGPVLADIVEACAKDGMRLAGIDALKTVPRGFPKDHPRADLLRRKGLAVSKHWPVAKWVHTGKAGDRVTDTWRSARPLNDWLNNHVGPSSEPSPMR